MKRNWLKKTMAATAVLIVAAVAAWGSDLGDAPGSADLDAKEDTFEAARTAAGVHEFLERQDESLADVSIGAHLFADLNRDGVDDILIVALDPSGRGFFTKALVVSAGEGDGGYRLQTLPTWNLSDLEGVLRDIDGEGEPELLLPERLSPYEGAACVAVWTKIYKWSGAEFEEASHRFPGLYKVRLEELERAVNSRTQRGERVCLLIERDKLLRFLGIDADAGMEHAIEWKDSTDPALRRKAVVVFSDVGTEEARKHLERLAHDPNSSVSVLAREQLASGIKH